jgi:predicted transcriptional regulator of viral defense system
MPAGEPQFTEPPGRDHASARLAARQHGVVSRAQLRALGLSDSAVSSRFGAGRLHRVHRGVYRQLEHDTSAIVETLVATLELS